jgi:flagellar protein FlbD
MTVILVTRLNGPAFAVNPDLIQRAESTPDTVVTLVDGTKFVVTESVDELVARIRDFRASVIAAAHELEVGTDLGGGRPHRARDPRAAQQSHSQVLQLPVRES